MARKFDYRPLLAPGRHALSLNELQHLTVNGFTSPSSERRAQMFAALRILMSDISLVKLPCQVFVDGSFLTEKPYPSDIDILIAIYDGISLDEGQLATVSRVSTTTFYDGVDGQVFVDYDREHPLHGMGFDSAEVVRSFSLENGGGHLKGVAVLRPWETNVGLRICR
jgi:hypothetical protein